jgi:hypothetical protein
MKYKKSVKITSLINDEYVVLGADAERLFRQPGKGVLLKRVLVIAACMTLLAVGMVAVLLPAMRPNIPPVTETTPPDSYPETDSSVIMLTDKNYVRVEYLSVKGAAATDDSESTIINKSTLETEEFNSGIGRRMILLHFECVEGETVTITPTAHSRLIPVYKSYTVDGYERWMAWDGEEDQYYYPTEYLNHYGNTGIEGLGESMTITTDTTLLWQFEVRRSVGRPSRILPCIEDNFVDFLLRDIEGQITGGGSVYVGGLDIAAMSEDKTYYDYNDVILNAIYRPYVLGSYEYLAGNDESVSEEFHEKTVTALHNSAETVREDLFDDLAADSYRFSMRELLREQYDTFIVREEGGGYRWGIEKDVYIQSVYFDSFVIVTSPNTDRSFMLYDFGYTEIAEKHIEVDNGYGRMQKGVYVLTDGTRIYVDASTSEVFTVVPPQGIENH